MNRPTNDPNPIDLVAGHILGDLSPEEVAQLNQALAETPTLHEEIATFEEAFSLLPYDLPIAEPSASLKDKILSAASQPIAGASPEPAPSNVVSIASPRQRRWQRWIPAISAGIAAAAVVALGVSQVQLSRQSEQIEAANAELERLRSELQANQATIALLNQPDVQVHSLVGTPSNPDSRLATARLLAKPGDVSVTIVAQDLPKLSSDRIYRLWAVATPSSAPMYCGQFRQDETGTAQWIAPNAACTQNPLQLLITLDAPTDPTTSAGPLVMQSFG
ncbi:MAG: hypothetical protein HC895_12585 [Leptolyngbyaceae cyanobacterium SM1_3_5]|nr:hypothetical protein [Leptolyngbyaceae cyanobacterium SM1_3_5]